jgi:signal transduction histidine kinase/ActR/RegA family two-component response regulator
LGGRHGKPQNPGAKITAKHHLKTDSSSAQVAATDEFPGSVNAGLARLCLVAAISPIAIAVLVLVGWIFSIELLKRGASDFVAMNPMTALSLIAAGTSLLILRKEGTTNVALKRIAQLAACAVAIVGMTKLVGIFANSDFAFDQWLFKSELANEAVPNRMAPNSALALLLCGLALLTIDFEFRRHRPAELLSVVAGVSALFALVGYVYRAPMFFGMAHGIPMALYSAIAIIALGVGILLARPRHGIMEVVASDTAGGIVARRLLPLAVVVPIVLGLLRFYGQASGLYDMQFGAALYSTAVVLVLLIAVWWMARILFHVDTERKYIARWQSDKLERTVQDRTRQLQHALKQLKDTQQQVLQRERLHALGTMASGVTHDFNNALSVIIGFGELALQECEQKAESNSVERFVRPMVVAALDGAKVVTRLREFYRPGGHEEPRAAVDLNKLIEQAVVITQPKWKSQRLGDGVKIEIKAELAAVPPAAGDAAELREALANLIFNAVDAMPRGGTITLRTLGEEDRVVVEVSDTGMGMSKDVQKQCLDPFFTTKGEQGTGLGLAMVYGIVERHGGTLKIESEEGRGTNFIISLPQYQRIDQVVEDGPPEVTSPLRVLIADDQPLLCEILAEYLKNDCHTVVAANDGKEALEKFKREKFDLVITDQAMPEMSGNQLARAIKKRSPSTPVILLTGFGEAGGDSTNVIDHVLSKPVSLIDLRHALLRATNNKVSEANAPASVENGKVASGLL